MSAEERNSSGMSSALGLRAGNFPFPWQERLLAQMVKGEIPRSLDIPTGLGKTSAMTIWLLARAKGADLPRRLIYIVDRRAVVDQATEEAVRLRAWVEADATIKSALGLTEKPLPVSTLRGQHADNREWLADPASPAIVVGTVDMIGSRLLFEAYAASRKMRPYFAGLLGIDSLFMLDEAHLIPTFERLLERIAFNGKDLGADSDVDWRVQSFQLLSLSATGSSRGGSPLELESDDLEHPIVRQRVHAKKQLVLEQLDKNGDMGVTLATRAWQLAKEADRPMRYLIFSNKRTDAEKASGVLRELAGLNKKPKKGEEPAVDVELLVGARRVFERAEAAERLRQLGFTAGSDMTLKRPAFLFATSAGEVGIDLDADHAVFDLVAWERMIQRLGRVNRRGQNPNHVAKIAVIANLPQLDQEVAELQKRDTSQLDEKQFEKVAEYEAALAPVEIIRQLPKKSGAYDASVMAVTDLQQRARSDEPLCELANRAATRSPHFPPLDRATLDAWSMTSLTAHTGRPEVAPWLRGWVDDEPQTRLIWRHHLPVESGKSPDKQRVNRFFDSARPHLLEILETTSAAAVNVLRKRARSHMNLQKTKSKGKKSQQVGTECLSDSDVAVMVLSQTLEFQESYSVSALAQRDTDNLNRAFRGNVVVVNAQLGGLGDNGLLDASSQATGRVADHYPAFALPECEPRGNPKPIEQQLGWRVERTGTKPEEKTTGDPNDPRWRLATAIPLSFDDEGSAIELLRIYVFRGPSVREGNTTIARHVQALSEHHEWAAEAAAKLVDRLLLDDRWKKIFTIAAAGHDLGKGRDLWQDAMGAPRRRGARPLAKTLGGGNPRLLAGYRHEFGSVADVQTRNEFLALDEHDQDLVLHLIAAHHGHARPVIRPVDPSLPEDSPALRNRARDVALRFLRLQKHYGPWRLAWLEAVLRAADWQASNRNDRQGGISNG